jgi:hypothetical protein
MRLALAAHSFGGSHLRGFSMAETNHIVGMLW